MPGREDEILRRLSRPNLIQDDAQVYTIPLMDFRRTGDMRQLLPAAPDDTNMGLLNTAHGTDHPILKSVGTGGASVTEKARIQCILPPEYVAGQSVTLRLYVQRILAATASYTLDAQVHSHDKDGTVSADLCATAAQLGSTSYANMDFVITATTLSAGMVLDIELTAVIDDTAGAIMCGYKIGDAALLLDIKG